MRSQGPTKIQIPQKGISRDFFSPMERSALMSRVRGRANISTELRIATILRAHKIKGWRRHLPLPGRPDFTFLTQRVCIFVHGCFWHDCRRCRKRSNTRPNYWATKIEANRRRDRRVIRELHQRGYSTIVVWECTLRRKQPVVATRQLISRLREYGIRPHVARSLRRA